MSLDDLLSGEVQIHTIVNPGQLQIPPRLVRLQKHQLDAAIVLHLVGAVVVHGVRSEHGYGQKAIVGIVPLNFDLARPVICRGVEMQCQTAATVILVEADIQHGRIGKSTVSVRLFRAPKAPEILPRRFGKKQEAAVHEPLPRFQRAVLVLIRHGFQQ